MSAGRRGRVAFCGVCALLAASVGVANLQVSTAVRAGLLTALLFVECAAVIWASVPGRMAQKALWLLTSVAVAVPYVVELFSDARWRGR